MQRDSLETPAARKFSLDAKGRAVSEPGWDHIDGRRWGKRNVSDPGVDMPDAPHDKTHEKDMQKRGQAADTPNGSQRPGTSRPQVCACCGEAHAQDTGEVPISTCHGCHKQPLCGSCAHFWAPGPGLAAVTMCCTCMGEPHSPPEVPLPLSQRNPAGWVRHAAASRGAARSGSESGSGVCLRAAPGPGMKSPPTLFERRTTPTTTTTATLEGPAGTANKLDVVAGHSGADHPLVEKNNQRVLRTNPELPPATTGDLRC